MTKFQNIRKIVWVIWILGFGICLGFVIWYLEFEGRLLKSYA
jgi:hypothetical protein